mmetsp:Transcript_1319/g.2022  ORF Transcript_1319/g.2022 Transcript_1319/m.2022 type:complete len:203 (+) Transcript_1319:212-820(+)
MARAEVTTIISLIRYWDTTQMGADALADQPLWLEATFGICCWLAERRGKDIILSRFLDHLRRAPSDEDGLPAPLAHEILSYADLSQIHFHNACCEYVFRRPHGVNELAGNNSHQGARYEAGSSCQEVYPWAAICVANRQTVLMEVQCTFRTRRCWHRSILRPPNRSEVLRRKLGDRSDGRFAGIVPNIGTNNLRTRCELALG